ncbi:MAG TPA: thermonuclease family protein [Rhizomicrobium sp.]|nr:thermonuclease family protein [Rhizomicrobium sp.]
MGDIIPFWRKKRRLNWIEGVTPRKKRSWRIPPAMPGGLVVAALIGMVIWLPPDPSQLGRFIPDWLSPGYFRLCHIGGGWNCVVDGDTFWYQGIRIRVADIDTPETHPSRCAAEADLGQRATLRLQELLNQGPFILTAIDRDEDRYGRKLRIVMRDGVSLGARLVDEGLARRWTGSRQPWC